ncbi:unnamed protein product [Discosporangium mesarthrocarpum]
MGVACAGQSGEDPSSGHKNVGLGSSASLVEPEVGHAPLHAKLGMSTAVMTGILHGFTGTGHLVGVMPALAMPSWGSASSYLTGFCLGTLLTMAVFTAAVGALSVQLHKRTGPAAVARVSCLASAFAVAMGCWSLICWVFPAPVAVPR